MVIPRAGDRQPRRELGLHPALVEPMAGGQFPGRLLRAIETYSEFTRRTEQAGSLQNGPASRLARSLARWAIRRVRVVRESPEIGASRLEVLGC